MWTSASSRNRANMNAEIRLVVSSACVPLDTSCYPTAEAVKVNVSLNCFKTSTFPSNYYSYILIPSLSLRH